MIGIDVLAGLLLVVAVVLCLALPAGLLWLVYKILLGAVWLGAKLISGLSWALGSGARRIGAFVGGEVKDSFSIIGSSIATVVLLPRIIASVVLGRWSEANHFGGAVREEIRGIVCSSYRIAIGHPARLLGLDSITRGLEQRVPDAVRRAPGPDMPPGKAAEFPGYVVVGSLPRGGSGAHLYLAEPLPEKYDRFAADGRSCPGRVVIKHFSRHYGSTLPQILRENRALMAARNLGVVLDHQEDNDGLFYVMPYVPGDDLAVVTRRLHDLSGPEGLDEDRLKVGGGYVADLVESLEHFHNKGLWHKDIKPNNVIVSNDGRAYLVDIGLVTPLASAMTLTTHGTEYYRDPEMVRLAMQGVKVHEVSGVKFDLYSAGAVLYSVLENSFPAHGGLSTVTKRCPEALQWIVRRSMADMNSRYASAGDMLADLRFVLAAEEPFALRPSDLPSTRGDHVAVGQMEESMRDPFAAFPNPPRSTPVPPPVAPPKRMSGRETRRAARVAHREARTARRAAKAEMKRQRKPRTRTRLAGGVVIASFLFMAMSAVPIARLVRSGTSHRGAPSQAIAAHAVSGSGSPRWSAVPRAESERFEAQIQALLAQAQEGDRPRSPYEARARAVAQREGSGRTDVLILNDLPATAKDEVLTDLLDALDLNAIEVIGVRPGVRAKERDIELTARARHSAGVTNPTDDLAVSRLRTLVNETRGLDAILWLGEGRERGSLVYRVVGKSGRRDAPGRSPSLYVSPSGRTLMRSR